MKAKLSSQDQDSNATPLSAQRRRVVSESSTQPREFSLGNKFLCTRIRDDGYHNCGSQSRLLNIHKQSKFLNLMNTCMFSPSLISKASSSVLNKHCATASRQNESDPNSGEAFFQSANMNYSAMSDSKEECKSNFLKDLLEPVSNENCLRILLCCTNDHTKAITGQEMKHNGIKIIK